MVTTKQFQLGSISTGTLRTDDLLKAFAIALDKLDSAKDPWLITEAWNLTRRNHANQQECDDRLTDLQDALQELCPPFVYFGALDGDGADFGFWPDHDALDEELHFGSKVCDDILVSRDCDCENEDCNHGLLVNVNDHGNVTVMDLDRQVLWSTV